MERVPFLPVGSPVPEVAAARAERCRRSRDRGQTPTFRPDVLGSVWIWKTRRVREVRFVEPTSSSGGRRFSPIAELDLHGHVARVAGSLPGPLGDVLVIPEMPSPLGLPDFVALVGGEAWLAARASIGAAPILAETECVVLSVFAAHRALSLPSIAKRLSWSPERLEPVLGRLQRNGAVETTSGGAYLRTPGLLPAGSLYAIEAKVRDWRKAMRQGRSYRTWANNYVVLLGEVGSVAVQRARAEVAEDGAGLNIGGEWIVRPRSRVPATARRLIGFEHLFAAVASDPALRPHEQF